MIDFDELDFCFSDIEMEREAEDNSFSSLPLGYIPN